MQALLSRRAAFRRHGRHRDLAISATAAAAPLVNWVKSSGGSVNEAVEVQFLGGGQGFGLTCQTDVAQGTKLIQLPLNCQLTYDSKKSDPRLLTVINQVPAELWGAKLALQLLAHRVAGQESPFSLYVANLPIGVAGVPTFFPRDAVQALEYAPLTAQVAKRGRWMHEFATRVLGPLPGTPADPFSGTQVDTNALGWAMACVTSRAFRTRGPQHPAAMLPLIDMANHDFNANCEVLPVDKGDGAVAMFAKRNISAGEPLLLNYGMLPNDFLLLDYGFVIPDNQHDRVTLRFDLDLLQVGADVAHVKGPGGGPLEIGVEKWRPCLLEQLGLQGPKANPEVTLGGPQHVDTRLLAAARICVAQSQAEIEGRNLQRLGDFKAPLSRANEGPALKLLAGVAAVALSRFTTSLDHDLELLAGRSPAAGSSPAQEAAGGAEATGSAPGTTSLPAVPLTPEMRLAVLFRVEKKKLLSRVIQALGERLQQLPSMAGLPATTAPSSPAKGSKPAPATSRGFGAPENSKKA